MREDFILQVYPGQCNECGKQVVSALFVGVDGCRWFIRLDNCKIEEVPVTTGKKMMPVDGEPLFEHRHNEYKKTSIAHRITA